MRKDTLSGPKKPNFYGVCIEIEEFGNFFDRKSFHFFQYEHSTIAFIQKPEQTLHALLCGQLRRGVGTSRILLVRRLILPALLLTQIRLVNQGTNFALP